MFLFSHDLFFPINTDILFLLKAYMGPVKVFVIVRDFRKAFLRFKSIWNSRQINLYVITVFAKEKCDCSCALKEGPIHTGPLQELHFVLALSGA